MAIKPRLEMLIRQGDTDDCPVAQGRVDPPIARLVCDMGQSHGAGRPRLRLASLMRRAYRSVGTNLLLSNVEPADRIVDVLRQEG
jgi:hypothetical protein